MKPPSSAVYPVSSQVYPGAQPTALLQMAPPGQQYGPQVPVPDEPKHAAPGMQSVLSMHDPPLPRAGDSQDQTGLSVEIARPLGSSDPRSSRRAATGCSCLRVVGKTQQAPAAQRRGPDRHSCPQVPQLCGSVDVSAHVPLQMVWPGGHAQEPPWQVLPFVQATPQVPQLFVSVWRLAQVVGFTIGHMVGLDAGHEQVPRCTGRSQGTRVRKRRSCPSRTGDWCTRWGWRPGTCLDWPWLRRRPPRIRSSSGTPRHTSSSCSGRSGYWCRRLRRGWRETNTGSCRHCKPARSCRRSRNFRSWRDPTRRRCTCPCSTPGTPSRPRRTRRSLRDRSTCPRTRRDRASRRYPGRRTLPAGKSNRWGKPPRSHRSSLRPPRCPCTRRCRRYRPGCCKHTSRPYRACRSSRPPHNHRSCPGPASYPRRRRCTNG